MVNKIRYRKTDIEDFATSLGHLDQDVKQLSGKTFNFSSDLVILPKISLSKIEIGRSAMFHGACDPNYVSFTIPVDRTPIRVNGITVYSNNLYIMPPTEEIIALFEYGLTGYHFAIDMGFLKQFIERKTYDEFIINAEKIRSGKIIIEDLEFIKNDIIKVINFTISQHSYLSGVVVNDIQDRISNSIRLLFENSHKAPEINLPYNKRRAIVIRALDFIKNSDSIYASIPEIAKYCFCSVRTLEYAFKKVLSLTPKQYLISRRFNMINRDLILNDNIGIGEIVDKYGIVNKGRFSREYFDFYGEYPKDTRKKKHVISGLF